MGIHTEEFGRLTLGLLDLLIKRREIDENAKYARTGMVAAAVINFAMCHPEKPVSHTDFIPGYVAEEKDMREWTPQEQADYIRNMFSKKTYNRK